MQGWQLLPRGGHADDCWTAESVFATVTDLYPERHLDHLAPLCRQGELPTSFALRWSSAPHTRSLALPSLDQALQAPEHACRTKKGTPLLLCITGNAKRAADLARGLRPLLPAESSADGGTVAKLFARHFKVTEQVDFLKTHVSPVAVGTPARMAQLLDTDGDSALHLDHIEAVVLDATWKDAKERTVLDGLDTRQDLFKLLARIEINERIRSGACKILLY